jgi:hypothetical protein
VFAQGTYGIFYMAEYYMLLGGSSKIYRQAPAHFRKSWPSIG